MEWITRKRDKRITNHEIVLTKSLNGFYQSNPVIDNPLCPPSAIPLHGEAALHLISIDFQI